MYVPNRPWTKNVRPQLSIDKDLELSLDNDEHIETVVLLSRKNPDDFLEITWTAHDFGNKGCKPTYEQIKSFILKEYGISVSSLYIAQIKEKCGIKERENYYIGAEGHKVPICPKDKEDAIMKAFKHFQII